MASSSTHCALCRAQATALALDWKQVVTGQGALLGMLCPGCARRPVNQYEPARSLLPVRPS